MLPRFQLQGVQQLRAVLPFKCPSPRREVAFRRFPPSDTPFLTEPIPTFRLTFKPLFLVLASLVAAGCGSDVVVTEVLNHHTCRLSGPGVKQIGHDELPKLRGAQLLLEPGQDDPDLAGDKPRFLIAVSLGSQPTGGYGLTLSKAGQTGDVITLDYAWQTPDSGSARSRMVTTHAQSSSSKIAMLLI